MTQLLDVALAARAAGLSVVPPRQDGTKAPLGEWKRYTTDRPDEGQLRSWYANGRTGIGAICGTVSGGLEVLEFEGRAVTEGQHLRFRELCRAAGLDDVLDRVLSGYSEQSPSGGIHLVYRVPTPYRNSKLARRPATDEELAANPDERVKVLVESRGEGGYIILAPSHGSVHETGEPYRMLSGGLESIATLTDEERDELWRVARMLDAMPEPAPSAPRTPPDPSEGTRPGDDYNARPDVHERVLELLEGRGWQRVYTAGEVDYLRRPGKARGVSATLGHVGPGVLRVFTTSTELEDKAYSPFGLYATLEHGGDYAAAARELGRQGYGSRPASTVLPAVTPNDPQRVGAAEEREDGRTTWAPVDATALVEGTYERPQPSQLVRADGLALLYPSATNAIFGESESGKSWLVHHATAQALARGETVLYLDFEATAENVYGRLLMLGVDPDALLARFAYVNPEEPLDERTRQDLDVTVRDLAPALVVIDGVTDAMGLHGLNLTDNADAVTFDQMLPRPLAKTGAAVVTVDHVPKSKETDAKYAVGAQHKRAAVMGASYRVDVVSPFAPGRAGWAKVTISKDRPGTVRQAAAQVAGEFHLDATDPDRPVAELRESRDARSTDGKFRPTVLMERVSRALEEAGEPLSKRGIFEAVSGRKDGKDVAIRVLVEEGYVTTETGQRNALLHRSVVPFRDSETIECVPSHNDHRSTVPDRSPDRSPAEPSDHGPRPFHRPYMGRGTGTVPGRPPRPTRRPPRLLAGVPRLRRPGGPHLGDRLALVRDVLGTRSGRCRMSSPAWCIGFPPSGPHVVTEERLDADGVLLCEPCWSRWAASHEREARR